MHILNDKSSTRFLAKDLYMDTVLYGDRWIMKNWAEFAPINIWEMLETWLVKIHTLERSNSINSPGFQHARDTIPGKIQCGW